VLLKNERNILLFRKPRNTLIAGNDVGPLTLGPDTKAFEYRVLAGSSGSSSYRFSFLLRPLDAVNARARKDGSLVRYI
jgi:beta-glucosidase